MEEVVDKNNIRKPVVAISIGEANGIGPEVVIKSLERPDLLAIVTPLVFCNSKVFSDQKKLLNSNLEVNMVKDLAHIKHGKINLYSISTEAFSLSMGIPTPASGKHALASLSEAADSVERGFAQFLVTAPIDKKNIEIHQKNFTGHTGFLAEKWKAKALMFLVSDGLRVALLTDHVPLSKVPSLLTKEELSSKIKQVHKSLVEDFFIEKPKIAVLGLNPHAGDNSLLGDEEVKIISPTISKLYNEGKLLVFGPYPADSFFNSKNLSNFDAVLAMYHDQGLVGFKTIAFYDGVNYTASLPFVRTSPDHGTAYDIAGKNLADATSMTNAIYTALDIYKKRKEYHSLKANAL